MRLGVAIVAVAVAMTGAAPAMACSHPILAPPPPPRTGVSEADAATLMAAWTISQMALSEAREREMAAYDQRRLFETAGSVLIARFDRAVEARSYLVPVQWLKGEPVAGELEFALSTWTCQAVASANGVHGAPGEVFVVYLRGNALLQADTLDARPLGRIVDPETLALVSQALMQPAQ
jgi:hypothetical protein